MSIPARAEASSAGQSLPGKSAQAGQALGQGRRPAPRRRPTPPRRRVRPSHLGRPDARCRARRPPPAMRTPARCRWRPHAPTRPRSAHCWRRARRSTATTTSSSTPLWHACASDAPADQRIAIVRLLLEAGASPLQQCEDRSTPLHAAARSGPLELVETLIRGGALSWMGDRRGKTALDYARAGNAPDRETIVELLDRPVIRDPNFRAAVDRHPRRRRRRPGPPAGPAPRAAAHARHRARLLSAGLLPRSQAVLVHRQQSDRDAEDAGQHRRHHPGDDRPGRRAGRPRQHAGAGHQQQRRDHGRPPGRGAGDPAGGRGQGVAAGDRGGAGALAASRRCRRCSTTAWP